jgi:hypothetical protein
VAILGAVPRVAAASLIAYFVGEFSNSYVLAKYKIRTVGKGMSWRFVISTALGQLIDWDIRHSGVYRQTSVA